MAKPSHGLNRKILSTYSGGNEKFQTIMYSCTDTGAAAANQLGGEYFQTTVVLYAYNFHIYSGSATLTNGKYE